MERVYLELKARTMRGDFQPGQRLEPSQIAQDLGVSPTPVRDALYRLSGERLVDSWHHEGFRQPILLEADIFDLYAWSVSLLLLALRGPARNHELRAEPIVDSEAESYPAEVARLFQNIAGLSPNRELRYAVMNMTDRCHIFRPAELHVDPKCREAIAVMDDDLSRGRWRSLRSKIRRFHQRRVLLVGRVSLELRSHQ
jgi:hypothetical protein